LEKKNRRRSYRISREQKRDLRLRRNSVQPPKNRAEGDLALLPNMTSHTLLPPRTHSTSEWTTEESTDIVEGHENDKWRQSQKPGLKKKIWVRKENIFWQSLTTCATRTRGVRAPDRVSATMTRGLQIINVGGKKREPLFNCLKIAWTRKGFGVWRRNSSGLRAVHPLSGQSMVGWGRERARSGNRRERVKARQGVRGGQGKDGGNA